MVNLKVVVSFLCIISISALYSQEKKKVFLANLQIGKSDISKEKQIDAIISESISEIVEVLTERDAYKYMTPAKTKKQIPCKTNDFLCIEKEIAPLIANTQKCIASKGSSPELCYLSYLKKYDITSLLILNIKSNSKDILFKLSLLTVSGDSFETENIYEKNILPFQLSFYLKEAPKFIFNPKLKVQVPKELYYSNDRVDLKEMKIEPFRKLDIEIYKFTTNDETIDALIEEQKSILKQGDALFLKSEYSRARNFYSGIIKAIEVGLRPIGLSKVSPYIVGLKSRIGLCDVNQFISTINQTDAKFIQKGMNLPIEELIEVMREYFSLFMQVDSFEYLDKKTEEKVKSGISKRINFLKTPVFSAWEKRADELFYQFKFVSTIDEYKSMISTLSSIFPLPSDINFYNTKYQKAIEDTKLKGKKILRDYIKSRSLMAERKNINYISQYFVESEKINDIKIYQIISENISNELIEILKNSEYDDYLSNGVKRTYNRVVFQINQSRKNINDSYTGEYVPYFTFKNNMNMEFQYIPGFESLVECEGSDKNCFIDYNGMNKKVITQKSFYMSKYEITQEVYLEILDQFSSRRERDKVLKSTANPSFFKECGGDCPVESISYEDVLGFIKILCKKEGYPNSCPYRVPSQFEWEFAAKGWNIEQYPGISGEGSDSNISEIANWGKNCTVSYTGSINLNELITESSYNPLKSIGKLFVNFDPSSFYPNNEIIEGYFLGASKGCGTQTVGKRLENFFSLYDMAGNVGEFCEKSSTSIGYCGGTWASMNPKDELQSSSFTTIKRAQKKPNVGFRLVYAPNEL